MSWRNSLLCRVADEQAVGERTGQLLNEIQRITPEKGKPPITCSIGAALYRRKKEGRAGVSFYDKILV